MQITVSLCMCVCIGGRRAQDLVSSHFYYLLCLHGGFERWERTERERWRCTCAVRQRMCVACGIRLTSHNEINWTATLRTNKTYSPRRLPTTHTRSFPRALLCRLIRHIGFVPSAALGIWFWSVFCISLFSHVSLSLIYIYVRRVCIWNLCAGIWKSWCNFSFFPVYSTKINSVKTFTTHSRKPAPKKPVCIPA